MSTLRIIPFSDLSTADLIVDAVYEGDNKIGAGSDPLARLLPVGNQGGFRFAGKGSNKKIVVLYTSGDDKDWPDRLELTTGQFIYFGDNKTPGHELHDTPRGGNTILQQTFEALHLPDRKFVPAFFIFMKYPTPSSSRSVQFKGLAVPGFPGVPQTEDLTASWKSTNQQRFQNYKAIFTVLDVPVVKREWITDLLNSEPLSINAPQPWRKWMDQGIYTPLTSEATTLIRTEKQQTPDSNQKIEILSTVWHYFKESPIAFEAFAARIFQMMDQRVIIDEITRGTIDGGRDAIGKYVLGLHQDPVYAEFSLEAKCYRPPFVTTESANTVGVKEVARLISRIRHRQFGVLVTTSIIARQAYEEVRSDKHPIIFICGKDIADTLVENGFNTKELVNGLLEKDFGIG
ncbi:MAG: restriction endonuclease [Chitinophagaceae bacterium]|nr:MAG: restriction endonuclease [Chitinophagaceae bacterium]HEX2846668.1 restriction endonuclease [Chitinophagaceae bacterium]